ncbi:hypothetical protein BDV26DRAFT_297794 [Aspergillus bertholletiae]|uniref:Carrier domain-containing protein n=1 Tax=Aspergillus bertholletiae TaxID=1226010 RepID=A0A5N7ARN2_9EURO|nr:hypothetical protein BDV26DRAFT_297794 [Aspergillus bertholletiae]
MLQRSNQGPSAAFFCPQNRPPSEQYLDQLRRYICANPFLKPFVQAILDMPAAWEIYASTNTAIGAMQQGPRYLENLKNWINGKATAPLAKIMSGIISLPLLLIIQIGQYFQYLEHRGIGHREFLDDIQVGGAQGFCGGLLPAIAIAVSRNEEELVKNAAICLRIALGIGAYGELGDDAAIPGPTTVVLHIKHAGQADEIVARFPGCYISAVTDPLTISVVGPVLLLQELKQIAEAEGVRVTPLHLRGKVHNPENSDLSNELSNLCDQTSSLRLPDSANIQVPVRSNTTGNVVTGVSLTREVVRATLVLRCEWYKLLTSLSQELFHTGSTEHMFAIFGTDKKSCISLVPFIEKKLTITNIDVMKYLGTGQIGGQSPLWDSLPSNAIAVIGAACRLPGANSLDELWELISAGGSKVSGLPLNRLNPDDTPRAAQRGSKKEYSRRYGNFIDSIDMFDRSFFNISARESEYMDPQQRLLLEVAYEALDSSGYLRHHRRGGSDNVGCFVGSTYTDYLETTNTCRPTAYTATGTIRAFQSGRISYYFGWSGPSEVIDTACSSSLVAIHRACRAIQANECPMALAGGVNIITGVHNFLDLEKAGFLSATGQCKPFSMAADGYCRADGVGLVVLKSLSQAITDGDDILGVISGVASNHGGLSSSITAPSSRAQTSLFESVIAQANIKPNHVSYVEAHGPGTQVGDPVEIASIREVFGRSYRDSPLYIGSVKGNVGHSETAAGVSGLLKVLAMLQHAEIPPLAGFRTLNPKIPALEPDGLQINTRVISWDAEFRAALINSYGAAGSNAALICSEPPRTPSRSSISTYPIFLSAATRDSLLAYMTILRAYIQKVSAREGLLNIGNLALTLRERRKHHGVQWVGVEKDLATFALSLKQGMDNCFEVPAPTKPVVLVFPGQSKQTVNLDPVWYQEFPRFRFYIDLCNDKLVHLGYPPIIPAIFQSNPIADVVVLQCGIFAVQYASAECWKEAGIKFHAAIGHSFGELTAMATTGILSLVDVLKLIASRASLVQYKWSAERGMMLAVQASAELTRQIMTTVNGTDPNREIEIACFNGPKSHVLVGCQSDIEKAEIILREGPQFRGIQYQRLDVSHGFHSVLTEPILSDLDRVANGLTFRAPTVPLEACTENSLSSFTAARIGRHTRMPVYFGSAVERIVQRLGPCVWLEVGIGSPVISMTKKAIQDHAGHSFLPIRTKGVDSAIAATTAALWREGISTSYWSFLTPDQAGLKPVWLPPYQFQRTHHWPDHLDADGCELEVLETGGLSMEKNLSSTIRPKNTSSFPMQNFTVNVEAKRYTQIVSGHTIRGRPLCPASMYMECVVMAAQMMQPGIEMQRLEFRNFSFERPLGLDINQNRGVRLSMERTADAKSWAVAIFSASKKNSKRAGLITTHVKGQFSATNSADFELYNRVIANQVQNLLADQRAERLKTTRAYILFRRVVDYAEPMRGISQITILDNRAVAQIKRPKVSVSSTESTAVPVCDTVILDTFIQVVGLLANSSDSCPDGEVFIASTVDSIQMRGCDFSACASWTVYAMTHTISAHQVVGDIFVFNSEGSLVLIGSGLQFRKCGTSKLEMVLHGLSSHEILQSPAHRPVEVLGEKVITGLTPPSGAEARLVRPLRHYVDGEMLDSLSMITHGSAERPSRTRQNSGQYRDDAYNFDLPTQAPQGSIGDSDQAISTALRQRITQIISENCGNEVSPSINDDISLEELGMDSISVVELKDSLERSFSLEFGAEHVRLQSTLGNILHHCSRTQHGA